MTAERAYEPRSVTFSGTTGEFTTWTFGEMPKLATNPDGSIKLLGQGDVVEGDGWRGGLVDVADLPDDVREAFEA